MTDGETKAKVYGTAMASPRGRASRRACAVAAAMTAESRRWRRWRGRRGPGASRPGSRRRPACWCWRYVIAHWGWRWLGPRRRPPSTARRRSAGRRRSSRRRSSDAPRRPRRAAASAPATLQGDTRLLGVFAGSDGTGHALFRLRDRGPVLVRSGEDIAKDVTLLEVRPDGVRIRDHGETRELASAHGAAPAPRRRGERRVRAERAPARRPPGYTGPVYRSTPNCSRASPRDRTAGRRCSRRSPAASRCATDSGFAAMLGMKPGDRMAQANGIALTGIDDIAGRLRQAAGREPAGARRRHRATASRRRGCSSTPGPVPG